MMNPSPHTHPGPLHIILGSMSPATFNSNSEFFFQVIHCTCTRQSRLGVVIPSRSEFRLLLQVNYQVHFWKLKSGEKKYSDSIELQDIVGGNEYFPPPCVKAAAKAALHFRKILHFNSHHAKVFVAAIFDPSAHEPVLVTVQTATFMVWTREQQCRFWIWHFLSQTPSKRNQTYSWAISFQELC